MDHSLDIDDDSSTAFSDDSVTADDHDIESGEMDSSKNTTSYLSYETNAVSTLFARC